MAGKVKVGTAYIDIKLGSFQEFKQAAEARAKEVAKSVAKKMSDDIAKNVKGTKAGEKIGDEVTSAATRKMSTLRSAWNNELGLTAKEASRSFVQSFGTGIKALSLGDLGFFTKAMGIAARDGVTLMSKAFQGLQPVFAKVGGYASTVVSGFQKLSGYAQTAFSKISGGLETISKGMETFGRKVGFASFMIQGLGYDLTLLVTAPLAAATAAIGFFGIKAALDLEQARASLAPFVGGLQNAGKEIEILAKIAADSPAFDTIQVVQYAKSLLSAGLTVSKTNDLFKASSNIFTTLGLSVDQANGAFYAITQIMQKGTAQSEELSQQLAERGIPIWKILADSLGVPQAALKDLVKQGKITSDIFVDAMIKAGNSGVYLNGAGLGADTVKAKFASLKEQVQYKLAVAFEKHLFPVLNYLLDKYGPSIGHMFDGIGGVLDDVNLSILKMEDRITSLAKRWDELSPKTKEQVKQFLGFLAAAGPTILIISKVGTGLGALATVAALVATPLGLVVLALAGLGLALYAIRDPLKEYFTNTEDGRKTTEAFKSVLKSVMDFVKADVAPALSELGKGVEQALYGFVTGKKDLDGIAGSFSSLRTFLNETASDLKKTVTPVVDQFSSSMKDLGIKMSAVEFIVNALKLGILTFIGIIGLVAAILSAVIGFIVVLVSGLVRVVTDILVGGFNFIVGVVKFFTHLFTGEWGKLGADVEQLWDGLWMLIVGTIWDAIMTIVDAVIALVKPIVKWFSWLYDVLVGHSIVPDMVNAIVKWITGMPGKILGFISSMVQSFVSYFLDMKNRAVAAVSDLAAQAAAKIGDVKNRILAAVSGFGTLLLNSGKELVQGLIDGIGRKLGDLQAIANKLASVVANVLPGSPVKTGPLKVLNNGYAGGQIVRMLADGMLDTKSVENAALSLASSAVPNIMSISSPAYSAGVLEPGASGGITINQTVNVPEAVQNPQELADYSTRRLVSALTTKAT